MADAQEPTTNVSATPAAVATPTSNAPVVETPVVAAAPAVVETPAAVVTEAATAPVPVVEPAKTETPADVKVENILGETKTEIKPEAIKPVEATKPEGDKPAEALKVELPTYEAFKLPENITLDKEPLDNFTKILGKIETGKLDHAGMQAVGQELIDLGIKNTVESINRLNDSYVQIHQQNQKARFDALKADPELGGDKLPETIAALQKSIGEYGGTAEQVAEFRKEITESGLGASPAVCRLLYNMQQKINKYTTEGDKNRMVPGAKPIPSVVKDYQRFYSGSN